MDKKSHTVNKGIQANNITAEVIAVGDHAKAIKNVTIISNKELFESVSALRAAISDLNLNENSKAVVSEDVKKLEYAIRKEKPDREEIKGILQSISGKLKMVGVVLKNTANLIEPVKKIASFLGTTISILGFL